MYSPSFYREQNFTAIHRLIEAYGFATLLTPGSGESISHLPMIMQPDSMNEPELICHMARANPHWKELEQKGRAKAIFHGPHAYISPAWYRPQADNVPTWNYAVVHAQGDFEIVSDPATAFELMRKLVERFETAYGTHWQLPHHEPQVEALLRSIVVFKLRHLKFEAKFKMSQKQDRVDRANVIRGLRATSEAGASMTAQLMEESLIPALGI